ncbi:hypothetical protein CU098_001879, partial [Rhizopus stolonifer]
MLNIFQAAYKGKLFIVQQMLDKDKGLLNAFDDDGRNPLHWAASGGHADIVDYLLKMGALINSQDKEAGWTPLLIAGNVSKIVSIYLSIIKVSAGHTDVVKLLLEKGADPSLENETSQSV